jgi:adenosylhomocysteine nucleosidase
MIAAFFALKEELSELLQVLPVRKKGEKKGKATYYRGRTQAHDFLLVRTAVGAESSKNALADLLRSERPRLLISAGYAGGALKGLPGGTIIVGETIAALEESSGRDCEFVVADQLFVDRRLVDRCMEVAAESDIPARKGMAATVPRVLRTRLEKEGLRRCGPILSMDLETFALARMCRDNGIPFLSLRGISDPVELDIPEGVTKPRAEHSFRRPGSCGIIDDGENSALASFRDNCKRSRAGYGKILVALLHDAALPVTHNHR